MAISIDGSGLSLTDFVSICRCGKTVFLTAETEARISASRASLEELINTGDVFYGVNTGFGALAGRKIARNDLRDLQKNLIRSHMTGVGAPLDRETVRGIMVLRANVLAKGFSGVRLQVVSLLLELLNHDIVPVIPEKGSVGASGDLAPLAHLAAVLMGEGEVRPSGKGEPVPTLSVFKKKDLAPVELMEKEGLALINGTQVMTALGILNLVEAEDLVKIADIAGALTFEAQRGNPAPFYDEIQLIRPHPGQLQTARFLRKLLKDSPLWLSHQGGEKVQDAYSIRCIPQVHGAVRDTLQHIRRVLEVEVNSATENPVVFPDKKKILSGGNFHGEPVAFAMDFLSIVMTELGNISERRIDRLINPHTNQGLPSFLIEDNGLNSGFMLAHVTATALTSENRSLAHPASVDNIPTSANQEDHVSMGTIGARKAREVINNLKYILAIELMTAVQALDFFHLKSSPVLENVKAVIRSKVPFLKKDNRMDGYFSEIVDLIVNGDILDSVAGLE